MHFDPDQRPDGHALRQTMEKRKSGVGGSLTAADETKIDEDIADHVEAGERSNLP